MNRNIIAVIASLVILVAGVSLWRTMRPISDNRDVDSFVGVGQVLADETSKAVHDHGRVVAVINEFYQRPVGIEHIEWEAFRAELKNHPAVDLIATEVHPSNVDGSPGCSRAALTEILERHAQADAIVFLIPLPPWTSFKMKVANPPSVTAKVIVMSGPLAFQKNYYAGYFVSGILSVLIIGRMQNGPDQIANPKTPLEKFHNEYQIFTPDNYESLPQ